MSSIECIIYQKHAPKDGNLDDIIFVQVNAEMCEGCEECHTVCPTGAIQPISETDLPHVIDTAACVNCGQCLINCPAGAIYEGVSYIDEIINKLQDPETVVISMSAPAVGYGLGECFGALAKTDVSGKMYAALHELGFNHIFDTEFTPNTSTMKEGRQLIQRIKAEDHGDHPLPQFTSCCPGWIKFVETFYPDLTPNIFTRKSPIAALGAQAKAFVTEGVKTAPQNVYTVSIVPCIANKYEGLRPELSQNGLRDIDATINTRELAYMIKRAGINFNKLPDQEPDPIPRKSTDTSTNSDNDDGTMNAAHEGIKTADIEVPNFGTVKVAVANGLKNAAKLCDEVREGKSPYHFIEVMTCPGGCVNGGGQPITPKIQASMRSRSTKRDYCVRWD